MPRGPKRPVRRARTGAERRAARAPRSPRRRLRYAVQDAGDPLIRATRRAFEAARKVRGEIRSREPAARLRETAGHGLRVGAAATIRFGEIASRLIHAAGRALAARLALAAAAASRWVDRLSAVVTPLRAVVAVTGCAALLLAVSQFVDYRGVAVGAPDYAVYGDVEAVAPVPQVDRRSAGSAHAYVLLPVALAALAALIACIRGRWQLGRAISLLGGIVIAVSLLIDLPKGLDEGSQETIYSGVEARLVEGFYVQLTAGVVLVAGGLLVSRYARDAGLWRSGADSRTGVLRSADAAAARARARVT